MKTWGCLSVSSLFHSTYCPFIPILLQMIKFHFNNWMLFLCVYRAFFYSLIWWWVPWMIPYFVCCEECCYKYSATHISLICVPIFWIPRSKTGKWYSKLISSFFVFKQISILFSIVSGLIYVPTNSISVHMFPYIYIYI